MKKKLTLRPNRVILTPHKHAAFTLAEVLITLGIIGIVAAMTIPSLIQNTNDGALKTAFKKSFQNFSEARALMEKDSLLPYPSTGLYNKTFVNSLSSYMSFAKICGVSTSEGCWHQAGKWYNLYGVVNGVDMAQPGAVLPDGTMFAYVNQSTSANIPSIFDNGNNPAYLIDVNGFKKPNRIGFDIYAIQVFKDRVLPVGAPGTIVPLISAPECCRRTNNSSGYNNGISCAYNVILDIDY